MKLALLSKFKRLIKDPVHVTTPIELKDNPRYRKYRHAAIIRQDFDRIGVIDFILINLYKAYLMVHDKQWQEAFLTIYSSITLIEMFNEFIVCIRHTFMLALILEKLELQSKALSVLQYLRDLAEETNNNREVILVYESMGRLYQDMKEYSYAISCFKKML